MKNCIRCKKEKKKKKGFVWCQWFETTYFKIQLQKKKKKNLRIVYKTAIIFKKLNQMDTKLEKALKKEII